MVLKYACITLFLLIAFASAQSKDRNKKKYKMVCYFGSWASYRKGNDKFAIEKDIDPNLCTHLVYGFAKLENNEIASYDPYLDLEENRGLGSFAKFNNLKKLNPQLTTLIAIGGWSEGSVKYSNMVNDASARSKFVKSAVQFCLKYNFGGLDVDWEYPAERGGIPQDKKNFVLLLKELKQAFKPHGLLLTIAVASGKSIIDNAYDIPGISKYVDFINLMTYDFHGSWESATGANTPLYERPEESQADKVLNINFALNYWIKKGAPREKIVLGMALYGKSYTLADASKTHLGAPSKGPGRSGPITKESGTLGFNEICQYLKSGWKEVFVSKVEAPYAYSGDQWVSYDNKKSLEIKVDYLKKNKLGGGMVWSLENDDYKGRCYNEKYPLLTVISKKLNGPITKPKI